MIGSEDGAVSAADDGKTLVDADGKESPVAEVSPPACLWDGTWGREEDFTEEEVGGEVTAEAVPSLSC